MLCHPLKFEKEKKFFEYQILRLFINKNVSFHFNQDKTLDCCAKRGFEQFRAGVYEFSSFLYDLIHYHIYCAYIPSPVHQIIG